MSWGGDSCKPTEMAEGCDGGAGWHKSAAVLHSDWAIGCCGSFDRCEMRHRQGGAGKWRGTLAWFCI